VTKQSALPSIIPNLFSAVTKFESFELWEKIVLAACSVLLPGQITGSWPCTGMTFNEEKLMDFPISNLIGEVHPMQAHIKLKGRVAEA
jgi:hypothetical protein